MDWDPSRFFRATGNASPYALLVLNQPINEKAFGVLSEHGEGFPIGADRPPSYIICADGGANRLYNVTKSLGKQSTQLPDVIVGDCDSILPSVRHHYAKLRVPIIVDPDQYSTDFTKCLKYVNEHAAEIIKAPRQKAGNSKESHRLSGSHTILDIVILGGLGGRVDQAFSQIHHLYMMTQSQRQLQEAHHTKNVENKKASSATGGDLYLVSEESITFVLQKGKNTIRTPATRRPGAFKASSNSHQENVDPTKKRKRAEEPDQEYLFEENIGIIPLSTPASITTHGFEWDVQDWHTKIGGQISTSNHIRADTVEVETSVPVLFTVELAERLKR
ncbi:hypothetical protein N7470_003066 [Penicillium chermesinum]|nr:hypothetical protein N7470_003066 [Penicillium chermesinum]